MTDRLLQESAGRPRVRVLMATHNGAPWLDAQLDSILDQQGVDVKVLVSDDASTDDTLDRLQTRARADDRIAVIANERRFGSAAPNFYHLVRRAQIDEGALYAFADQDDIWDLDKLSRHAGILRSQDVSGVSSDVTAFWPDGRRVAIRKAFGQRRWDHLFESPGPGCTFLMRPEVLRRCREVLDDLEADGEEPLPYHDWMIYLVARSSGMRWWIDGTPSILYRQHGRNEVGANVGLRALAERGRFIARGNYRALVRRAMEIGVRCGRGSAGSASHLSSLQILCHGRRRLRDALVATLAMPWGVSATMHKRASHREVGTA